MAADDRHVVIIGGGIAGLSTGWFLARGGAKVTILEARTIGSGSSFANGGWLCPAQAGPLAEPGLTLFAMRSFLQRSSPLYISPRYLPHAASWFLQFRRYCTPAAYEHGMSAIARLGLDTFRLVEEWQRAGVEFEIYKQGMIYAARDEASAAAALAGLQPMREFGYLLPDALMLRDELHEFEPALSSAISAGFLIEEHWHVRSDSLMAGLAEWLRERGNEIVEGAEVTAVNVSTTGRVLSVDTPVASYEADDFLFTTGSWTEAMDQLPGPRIPIEAGKGYSFAVRPTVMPRHAVLLTDVHVGCTPFDGFLRIGGTMEFSGVNRHIDRRRVQTIVTGAKASFQPFADDQITQLWTGPRPITPDGLPVVGRAPGTRNAYIGNGHAMQGVSLSPGSGRALARLILTGELDEVLVPFDPGRFHRGVLTRRAG
jgi:D-amino-acid dehydrogenase